MQFSLHKVSFIIAWLSKAEVKSIVEEALAALDNVNKGIAMKTVMPLLKGKAEGKDVSDAVDEYLEEKGGQ